MKTSKWMLPILLLAAVPFLSLVPQAQAGIRIGIGVGSPGYYNDSPYADRYWVPGHWAFYRGDQVWVRGYWVYTNQDPYDGGYGYGGPSFYIGGGGHHHHHHY